jgi:hypothetical protein
MLSFGRVYTHINSRRRVITQKKAYNIILLNRVPEKNLTSRPIAAVQV